MSKPSAHVLAVLLSLAWAGFWIFFVLASTWGEPGSLGQKLMISAIGVGILLFSTVAPFANPRLGGALLLLEGVALTVANFTFLRNPPGTQAFLFVTMALPPMVAGALYLYASWSPHRLPG